MKIIEVSSVNPNKEVMNWFGEIGERERKGRWRIGEQIQVEAENDNKFWIAEVELVITSKLICIQRLKFYGGDLGSVFRETFTDEDKIFSYEELSSEVIVTLVGFKIVNPPI